MNRIEGPRMSTLQQIMQERRSATKFLPNVEMTQQDLDAIFNLVKYSPSCFNLQHAHYLVIRDREQLQQFHDQAAPQYKLLTASAAILVLGDVKAYEKAEELYEGMLHLRLLSQEEYDATTQSIRGLYESRGEGFCRDEAIRNASLSAMNFMLAAKDLGWDTCPMIGFDPDAARRLFNVPDRLLPVMLITIGKEDLSKRRPRGYRKPLGEFVTYDSFE